MTARAHPAWKRAYARRAARVNAATSIKAVARRLGVPPDTISNWHWQDRRSGVGR